MENVAKRIEIIFNGIKIADSFETKRILETSHPPVYYIPPHDIKMTYLLEAGAGSFCEWKGRANYYSLRVNKKRAERAAWYYPEPLQSYKEIKDYIAFYAGPLDGCFIDGEKVLPQPGEFYGGWITKEVVGPFKGEPGTEWW